MKFLIQVVCCLAIVLFNNQSINAFPLNGSDQIYLIQLAASSEPDLKQFKNIKRYGYIYTSTTNTGIQKVLLGSFTTKSAAKSVLSKVKARGHKDAFLTTQPIDPNGKIYSVQMISYAYATSIDWEKFNRMGDVRIDPSAGKIKLMRGTFYDQESARSYAKSVESEGYKGAFIREINEGVLLWPDHNFYVTTGTLATSTSATHTSTSTSPTSTSTNSTVSTTGALTYADPYKSPIYTSLSSFEKEKVIYLDGVLSIKQYGKIVPLKDYVPGTLTGSTITTPGNAVITPAPTNVVPTSAPTSATTTVVTGEPSVTQIEPVTAPVIVGEEQVIMQSTPNVAVATQGTLSTSPVAINNDMTAKGVNRAAATYKIQLTAVSMYDPLKFSSVDYLGTVDTEDTASGVKRIMLGTFVTKEDASQALNQIKEKGFGNAYIVEYDNGTRK